MKTIIKTEDILKILEPTTDGITYKDQKLKLNFETITNYVNNPKHFKVFEKSDNIEDSFYRNIALYIINADEDYKYIQIDLNKDISIENGLFEFIKNVFNNEKFTYISLPEEGNNLILIKSKKLQELPVTESSFVKQAVDVEFGGRTSVFMKTETVTEKEKFFWKAQESDRYSDTDFLVNKLIDVAKKINFSKSSVRDEVDDSDKEFFSVLKVADQNIIKSDAFKLALLKSKNENINKILIKDNQPKIFSINFSADFVRDFILEQVGQNNFHFLSSIFKHNALATKKNTYQWVKDAVEAKKMKFETVHKIDFHQIINHANTIKYLLEQRNRDLNIYGEDDNFSIVSAYPYFNKENKVNPGIVNKFLEIIITKSQSDIRIQEKQLYNMPMSLFNEEYFLEQICAGLNFDNIKSKLKTKGIEPKLLSDTKFIIKNCSNVPAYRLTSWFNNFLSKEKIDKEFLLNIVRVKPIFCETIIGSKYSIFKPFSKDKDIIFTAVKYGFDITRVPSRLMKEFFLEKDNEDYELMKIKYLIENKEYQNGKHWFKEPEQAQEFDAKYLKSEFMYFAKNDYFYSNDIREKTQNKFQSPREVIETLDKIKNFPYKYTFRADFFYKELPRHLQANKKILDKILECGGECFPFKNLSETLQYNSKVALRFIKMNPQNTLDVPKEFFNDIQFSLEFSKIIDSGIFRGKESLMPEFITKFFDNQNITEDYHKNLEHYVSVFSLKESLDEKPVLQKAKRIKI